MPEENSLGGVSQGEPEVGYAVIGAAFGLLLIFVGRLIPYRILSWPIIGVGVLFVVVMTLYTFLVRGKTKSAPIRRLLSRARGHIRNDPRLGMLTRDVAAHCWVATVTLDGRPLSVVIEGDDDPTPALVAHARDLLANFDTLERRVKDYLAREEKEEVDPQLAAEIRALRVSSINLRSPDRPSQVVIDFEGLDEMRFWYCNCIDGEMSGLNFDT
jgi:hypothetical protein